MTKQQVLGLAVKLFAIFLFIYGLRSVLGIIHIANGPHAFTGVWWIASSYLFLFICIAVLLWFFPVSVARRLLPKDDRKPGETNITLNDIDLVAYSILGVWLLATTIPEMVYWIILLSTLEHDRLMPYLSHARLANVIATATQFCIGVWLMFGARGVRGLIRTLRGTGH